jgi:hypothetical protein
VIDVSCIFSPALAMAQVTNRCSSSFRPFSRAVQIQSTGSQVRWIVSLCLVRRMYGRPSLNQRQGRERHSRQEVDESR